MPDDDAKEQKTILKKNMKEYILSMAVLKRADPNCYGSLQQGLRNNYLLGNDRYPTTLPETLKLLNNYKNPNLEINQNQGTNQGGRKTGTSFLQTTNGLKVEFLRGTDNSFEPEVECYKCKCYGHISIFCPIAKDNSGSPLPGGVMRRNRYRNSRGGKGNKAIGRGNGSENGRWTLVNCGKGASGSGSGETSMNGTADGNVATGEEVSLKIGVVFL